MLIRTMVCLILVSLVAVSCGEKNQPVENHGKKVDEEKAVNVPVIAPTPPQTPQVWSEVKLHEVIRSKNPGYSGNGQFEIDEAGQVRAVALDNCGVTDLSPFQGMSLMALYLQGCAVPDISPLQGMPLVELYLEKSAVKDLSPLAGMGGLRKLYLSGTMVTDLSPLKGLAIVEMNLVNTKVSDLSALAGMPLQMLWLTDTPVSDISPLAKSPLVSLTLHRTSVSDLSPLAGTNLQRLHIGETPVSDLTPLKGMRLTRLVFEPGMIKTGFDVITQMTTLTEVGTKFEDGSNDLQPLASFLQSRAANSGGVQPEVK
ncbi:MAG: hypothetical protein ABL994_02660 [Verrucomicrobiales bacterium]